MFDAIKEDVREHFTGDGEDGNPSIVAILALSLAEWQNDPLAPILGDTLRGLHVVEELPDTLCRWSTGRFSNVGRNVVDSWSLPIFQPGDCHCNLLEVGTVCPDGCVFSSVGCCHGDVCRACCWRTIQHRVGVLLPSV